MKMERDQTGQECRNQTSSISSSGFMQQPSWVECYSKKWRVTNIMHCFGGSVCDLGDGIGPRDMESQVKRGFYKRPEVF